MTSSIQFIQGIVPTFFKKIKTKREATTEEQKRNACSCQCCTEFVMHLIDIYQFRHVLMTKKKQFLIQTLNSIFPFNNLLGANLFANKTCFHALLAIGNMHGYFIFATRICILKLHIVRGTFNDSTIFMFIADDYIFLLT